MKTKKTKKSVKLRGTNSHGHGARKKWKKSGHRGGVGMAGSGKRADQKNTLITKLYGNKYFGKQGITSKSTKKDRIKQINLRDIMKNLDSYKKKYEKDGILVLEKYRILGEGNIDVKLDIKAAGFSKSAKEKIEKAGGKTILVLEKKSVENTNKSKTHELEKSSSEVESDKTTKNKVKK
jgi:large subunit ribosomal protein L15